MPNDKLYNYIIKPPPPVAPIGEVVPVAQRITVVDKTKIKGSDRIKVIQKLFREHAPGDITITRWNDDRHEATILLDGQTFEVTTAEVEGQAPQVVLAFKEQGPQSRGAAFVASCEKLFSNYREKKIGFPEFLAKLLILPIWALYHMVTSFKGKEAQLENLLGNFSAHSPENFLEILESGVKFIKQMSSSANQDAVLAPMGEGIDLGRELLSAAKNPRLRSAFLDSLNPKISNLRDRESVLIPAGFYTKGQYHPVLLYVVKRGEQLVVQKYSLATPESSHTGRIPAFEEFELRADQVETFTHSLITLLEKPQGTATPAERLKAAGLDTQRYTPDVKVNNDPIGGVLTALGKRLAPAGRAVTPSEDPWKLIFSYVTSVNPALLPEKTVFMTHVLENMVSETLKYAERLPLDKKEAYYKVLDVRIKKLEKHLLKENPELADKIIGPIKAQIHKVVGESQAKMLRQGEVSVIRALSEPGKSAPIHLTIPTEVAQTRTEQDRAAQIEKSESVGIVANRADLQKLETAFTAPMARPTQAEAGEAVAALGALHTKIDQLIEAKDYIKARSAATIALAALPSIDNPGVFTHFTADQMDEMSQKIEQITGQLFEAKLRLSDDHPSPEELVHLLNGRALMVSMVRKRIQKVHAEAQNRFLNGGRTDELRARFGIPDHEEEFGDFFSPNVNVLQIKKLQRENEQKYREVNELDSQKQQFSPSSPQYMELVDQIVERTYEIHDNKQTIERLQAIPRNRANEAAKFKQIAEFLHELDIPLQDAQLLCFDDFTLDSEKYRSLLQDNPYLSYGYDANTAKKAGALAEFFVRDRGEFKERSAVLLNAFENSELFAPAERLFSGRLLQLYKTYEDQPIADQDFLSGAKTEIERTNTSLLPKFLIDLRRGEAWSDAVLNPKGSLYLGFETELGIKKWLLANVQQAQQGTSLGSPNFFKKLRVLQSNALRERLGEMDRVTLNIHQRTALDAVNPAIIFSAAGEGPATGLCLYPRRLPARFQELGFPADPLLFQDSLHYMPISLARAECGHTDEFLHFADDAPAHDYSILTKPSDTYAMTPHSPAYFYAAASENRLFPKLDPVDEAELLKLQSGQPDFGASYAFDFIIGRTHLLDHPDIQNRVLQVLFHDRGLIKYLRRNPDQVLASTRLIQEKIGECLGSNQLIQAAFLSFILQKVGENIAEATSFHTKIADGDLRAIEQLRQEEEFLTLTQEQPFSPVYSTTAQQRSRNALRILDELSRELGPGDPTPDKLFEALSNPEVWNKPEGRTFALFLLDKLNAASLAGLTPDKMVIVLKAWELIRGNQTEVTLPTLRQHLQLKMEGSILPAVSDRLERDEALRNAVLNTWKGSPSPKWQRDLENPCRFLATDALGVVQTYANDTGGQTTCYLDLISCETTMRTAVSNQRASNIPDEVVNLPLYNKVFEGRQFLANDVMGTTPSQRVYTFTSKGKNFQLVYDRSEQDASQKLSIYLTLDGIRYRYTTPTSSTQDNFAHVIEHYGIWVREGERAPTAFSPQQSAILFPGKIDDYPTPQALGDAAFTIKMDNVGNVKEISKKEGSATFQVFQDAKNTLASSFPFAHENDIVFMRREGEEFISRIQFLNEKITLELNPDGSWSPVGNRDWRWQQTDTRPLVNQFGSSYQHFLLPFRKGGQEQYRIFPNPASSTRLKETGETVLEFAPSSPWELAASPVLTITKDAAGVLHGTHAAFLYLAYVDFCQGNYERGVKHLNEASKANAKESEIPVIETIAKMMQSQPHPSGKQIAFQLKAALTIRTILRQSYQQFKIPASKESIRQNEAENQRLRTLSDEYDRIPHTAHLAASRLELTPEDKTELELFKAQALGAAKTRPAAPEIEAMRLSVPYHARASKAFLPYLILTMEPPIPGATKATLLQLGSSPTQENVLKHFWTYWTLIRDNTITLKDLSGFYLPIPAPPGTDPALVEAVDVARRTLLSFAAANETTNSLNQEMIRLKGELVVNKRTYKDLKAETIKEINLLILFEEMEALGHQPLTEDSSIDDCAAILHYIDEDRSTKAKGFIQDLKRLDNVNRGLEKRIYDINQKFRDVDRFQGITAAVTGAPNQEIFKLKKQVLEKEIIPTGGIPGLLTSFYDTMRQAKHIQAMSALEQACAVPIDALLGGGQQNFPGAVALLPRALSLAPHEAMAATLPEAKPPELQEIAVKSFEGLQRRIAEKEAAPLRPAVQVFTPIALTPRIGLLFDDYMSVDTHLPTDTELTRLSDVLTERPQYNAEWLATYTRIFNAEPNALAQPEPLDIRRSKDIGQQLLYAAASLKKAGHPIPPPSGFASKPAKLAGYKALRNAFGEQQKAEQIGKVRERSSMAQATFADTGNPLTDFDNARTKSGIAADAAKKIEALQSARFINERNVENFHRDLQVNITDLRRNVNAAAKDLVKAFTPEAKKFGLQETFRNTEQFSELDRLNAIVDLCENGAELPKEVLEKSADYLFLATELQQKEQALAELTALHDLGKQRREVNAELQRNRKLPRTPTLEAAAQNLEETLKTLEIEWKVVSTSITDKIRSGENHERYSAGFYKPKIIAVLDKKIREFGTELTKIGQEILASPNEPTKRKLTEKKALLEQRIQKLKARKETVSPETGGLVDQAQTLPYLVREYRQKIVFTPGQVEKIEIILDDPHAVEVFRMGLGKSSVIFPCVTRILVSRGELPIMIFTETLLEQSRQQMDKKAYVFNFSRGSSITPQTLAEEYYSLLTAKHIMTTVDRIAALRNKIIEVHNIQSQQFEAAQKLKDEHGEIPSNKRAEYDKLYGSMVETFEQLQWLKKIHAFFYAPDTRLVADEIDEIFSISSEKNFSDGKTPDPIDPTTFDAGEEIFKHVFESQNPVVQELRQAVIDDSLATWEPTKVQTAMKQVAIEILRDKDNATGYLRTHGWTQEQLDAIIPEDFGEYLSNLKAKVLPQGMAAWPKGPAEAGELKPFETMGALRHWMTKTIHTLSRKQAGKDYDYQKELDACQNVVPLKDQVEKPNTKFGQESELVGYHLLAYSRKVPPQEFFNEQISALRRKAAEEGAGSPCAILMQRIDPTGAGSPQEIYTRINDNAPGRFLDRIAFLRFVMRDQTLIRIYRSQITCPVQDTAGVLSGASGSLNLFSLPPDVSSDPSNMAKNVTGETLSLQSLMGKGFEEDITPFAELIPHMTGLTRDPKCKAIINQGYATENMPTKELIAHFRRENKVAGLQREYVFIDADKKAYFWLPGDKEQPRPFDKVLNAKDIHADRVLYYFAPADTRGTDFKIPSGYGALIIGPTTTPDEYDQAIWRLRALGKGQDVKVYIKDLHAAAIRETQEVEGNLQLGHVVRDVQLQGIKANTLQNFKAATSRPESTLRMRVADALLRPIEVGEVAILAQNREKMETVLKLNAQTFNAVKELYIRPKAMHYQSDYMPTDEEDITPFLESKHTETLERIDSTIAKKLPDEPSGSVAFNAWATGVQESLPLAKSEIEKHRLGLAAEDEKTKQNLEAKVDKSKSGDEDQTSEITQEQQQQQQTETAQQQEQQATVEGEGLKGDAYDSYDRPLINLNNPYFDSGVASGYVNLFQAMDMRNPKFPASAAFINCGIPTGLMFTQSFSAIMDQGRSPGKMLGLQFLYRTDEGKIGAYLMTGLDAEVMIPTVERTRRKEDALVLRMISLPEDPTQPPKDYCAPTGDIGNVDEANQLIAISKLLMGYATYPNHELAALRNWFTHLKPVEKNNLIATLHKRSAPEQTLKMLNSWLHL